MKSYQEKFISIAIQEQVPQFGDFTSNQDARAHISSMPQICFCQEYI